MSRIIGKTIAIVSAKFTPAFMAHIEAYYLLSKVVGLKPCLYLDRGYIAFEEEVKKFNYSYIGNIDYLAKYDYILFTNLSINDSKIVKRIKRINSDVKIMTVYHEPFRGFIKELSRSKELKVFVRCIGRYFFSRSLLKYSDTILLPSKAAEELYKLVDIKVNDKYEMLPLLFADHYDDFAGIKKEYISFIGNAALSKGYKEFLDFILIDSQRNSYRKYQIASSFDIKSNLGVKFDSLIKSGRLLINDNHPLTNKEINLAYSNSNCVWLCYKESTQSGVICKAQMFGAPCIATKVGDFTNKIDEKTGVFINDITSYEEINSALTKIEKALEDYVYYSREAYLQNYDYKNYSFLFSNILEKI